jgi:hypothetical protein
MTTFNVQSYVPTTAYHAMLDRIISAPCNTQGDLRHEPPPVQIGGAYSFSQLTEMWLAARTALPRPPNPQTAQSQ